MNVYIQKIYQMQYTFIYNFAKYNGRTLLYPVKLKYMYLKVLHSVTLTTGNLAIHSYRCPSLPLSYM